jgi:cobalt-zinc-cadmium efflux system protein
MHHGHAHAGLHHGHSHGVDRTVNRSRLAVALAINVVLVVAGIAGTVVFHSVALLADAGHILSDVGAIVLAMFAAAMAARPAAGRRTFGYYRTEILAALVNGLVLVAVAVLVFTEAVMRLGNPSDVNGAGVLIIGLVGLAGNIAATVALAGGDRADINLEAVLRHSAADALGSLGVVVSGALVLIGGWDRADPIAGIVIGILILVGSWRLIKEPVDVLMEAAPAGLEVQEVGTVMASVDGVREVHDLHVWTVTSGFPALAAHVRTDPAYDMDEVRHNLEHVLADRFGIEHTTLQMMVEQLLEIEDRRGEPPG